MRSQSANNGTSTGKIVIGVTGQIGSGKSTVARIISRCIDACLIDADRISHSLLKPGSKVYTRIKKVFGREIIGRDLSISRAKLAAKIFNDRSAMLTLNRIIHPFIMRIIKDKIRTCKRGIVVIDAPLLFEVGLDRYATSTVCVKASRELRVSRLSRRSGLSRRQVVLRNHAQMPGYKKASLADYRIDNNGTISRTAVQARIILDKIVKKAAIGKNKQH